MDLLQWQRPEEVTPDAGGVVEAADTGEGVLLRVGAGDAAVLIPHLAWADFLAAAATSEYDATLPSAEVTLNQLRAEHQAREAEDS